MKFSELRIVRFMVPVRPDAAMPCQRAGEFPGTLRTAPSPGGEYVFSVQSAAVLGSSNVSTPSTPQIYQISPALIPAPEDERTPPNMYGGEGRGEGERFLESHFLRSCPRISCARRQAFTRSDLTALVA